RGGHGLVVVPPDLVFGLGIAHHELVVGGAAGMDAGAHHQRTIGGDMAFTSAHGLLIKGRGTEIPVHGLEVAKSMTAEAESGVGHNCSEMPKDRFSYTHPSIDRQRYLIAVTQKFTFIVNMIFVLLNDGRDSLALPAS